MFPFLFLLSHICKFLRVSVLVRYVSMCLLFSFCSFVDGQNPAPVDLEIRSLQTSVLTNSTGAAE